MARRDVTDELRQDVLVDIAKGDERRFGTGGKMLKPSRATVEAALAKIPRGSVMTVTALRRQLAQQHRADTTCPFMTKRALMAIAEDARDRALLAHREAERRDDDLFPRRPRRPGATAQS